MVRRAAILLRRLEAMASWRPGSVYEALFDSDDDAVPRDVYDERFSQIYDALIAPEVVTSAGVSDGDAVPPNDALIAPEVVTSAVVVSQDSRVRTVDSSNGSYIRSVHPRLSLASGAASTSREGQKKADVLMRKDQEKSAGEIQSKVDEEKMKAEAWFGSRGDPCCIIFHLQPDTSSVISVAMQFADGCIQAYGGVTESPIWRWKGGKKKQGGFMKGHVETWGKHGDCTMNVLAARKGSFWIRELECRLIEALTNRLPPHQRGNIKQGGGGIKESDDDTTYFVYLLVQKDRHPVI